MTHLTTSMPGTRRYTLQLVKHGAFVEEAEWYAEQLIDSGLHRVAFYDGSVRTVEDFLKMARQRDVYLFLCFDNNTGKPCAHTHVNNFNGKTAHMHYSILPSHHGREAVRIGVEGTDQLMGLYREPGEFMFSALLGMTPTANRLALRLLSICGFEKVIDIPDVCQLADGTFHSGTLSIRRR